MINYEEHDRIRWAHMTRDLENSPTLCEGQAEDLKAELTLRNGTPARVWLSRCGVEDGEPWENTVSLETYQEGRWATVLRWNGDDPAEYEEE
jgi:hypothetical protein